MNRILLDFCNIIFLSLKQRNFCVEKSITGHLSHFRYLTVPFHLNRVKNQRKCDFFLKEKHEEQSRHYLNKSPVTVPLYPMSSSGFYHLSLGNGIIPTIKSIHFQLK